MRHATTTKPVIGVPLFVMKAFDPSITQSPASWRALVRNAAASDPLPGSVRPNPASISPAAIGGSQRWRCSALPYRAIMPAASPEATETVTATLASALPSSSITSAHVMASAPRPP